MNEYESFILRKAKVIDIDDPDKKGKIKVRIYPDFKDINDDLLPWAMPFISHNSTSCMENDLPEIGSIVRILLREDWQRFYYLSNIYYYELFKFDTVSSILDTIPELSEKEYQNLKFRLYLDGGLEFHNNSTGEHGYIHKSGSYYYFDQDGYFYLKDNAGNTIETSSSSIMLNGNLEVLQ